MADYNKIQKRREDLWLIKSDKELKNTLDNIRDARIKKNLDSVRDKTTYNDLLKGAFRFEPLLDILKRAKLDKKGQGFNLFTFMITAFLAVLFFGGLIYCMGLINGVFHQVGVMNDANTNPNVSGYVNMTQASDSIFGKVNESIQALRMVALVYILSLACLIFITNALVKIHPVYFFAYILIVVLAVVFAPTISNAYETLLNSGIYNGGLTSFTASYYILHNLPSIVMVIGLLGGVFLFINLLRNDNQGVLQ